MLVLPLLVRTFRLCALLGVFMLMADRAVASTPLRRVTLKTIYNSEHSLADLLDPDDRGLVLYFMHDTCPVVQLYLPRLKELHERYAAKGVRMVGIYANRGDSTFSMATHAAARRYSIFGVIRQATAATRCIGVERTCTAIVLDAKLNMLFKGPVDDQFTKGRAKSTASKNYLTDAIEALISTKEFPKVEAVAQVSSTATRDVTPSAAIEIPVSGCMISRVATDATPQEVTYHKDVLPIFQQRCQACHRPGDVAPFALFSYNEAVDWSAMIAEVVEERRMPPWGVVSKHKFIGDQSLSDQEIRTISDWVRGGTPEGSPADAPKAVTLAQRSAMEDRQARLGIRIRRAVCSAGHRRDRIPILCHQESVSR